MENLHLAREREDSHHHLFTLLTWLERGLNGLSLEAVANDLDIFTFEYHFAINLLTSQDGSDTVCLGVDTSNTKTQEVVQLFGGAFSLLASGGAGHLYPPTTNPLSLEMV